MLTFAELSVGDRFVFLNQFEDGTATYDWSWSIKTGERTYRDRTWSDGSGGEEGRVGVGDNPVRRLTKADALSVDNECDDG